MRLIDADALKQRVGSYNPVKYTSEYGDVVTVDDIDSAPTVDVVLCKNCKHQEKTFHADKRMKIGGYYVYFCDLAEDYSHVCLDEDFCSKGERRDDGDE